MSYTAKLWLLGAAVRGGGAEPDAGLRANVLEP